MTEPPIDAVVEAHQRRLATIDPLLPANHPLPQRRPDDELLTAPGAVALLRREVPDPESFTATWGAATRYLLIPRTGGADPAAAMGILLNGWAARVREQVTPGDPETEATLTWPSRDTVMTARFLAHGLVPGVVVAARPAGRPTPGAADPGVRPLREDDRDAAAALWLEEVRWDAQFGGVTERPSTAGAVEAALREATADDPPWAWVAEDPGRSGRLAGLLVLNPPAQAGWVAHLVSGSPTAYLSCLVVTAAGRGGGVGAALVRQAHTALDEAGVTLTLLHYAALNPLSGPFWHRCGYRPLWTGWQARPASGLRVTEMSIR